MNHMVSNKIFLKETLGGTMQDFGKAIKRIRKSRGMTQKYVGQGILSQAAFSKYEAGLTTVHSTAFVKILERLSLSLEEFEYIINGFEFSRPKNIINDFFRLPYNQVESLKKLILEIDEYLEGQSNSDLENIKIISEALICLNVEKDILKARDMVEPIWTKLSKLDQWYLIDIRLINSILYLFPNDVAIEMINTILLKIKNYQDFHEADRMIITVTINLSLLLINEKDFSQALQLLENLLKTQKARMAYQSLAIALIRISICRKLLGMRDEEHYLEQASNLLTIYDQSELLEQLLGEYTHYFNNQ